ncbi:hypothetical protein [Saccharothrix sp. Mg75]|uniref:hypothetical protein n=1 Tax=Saccharothrix sp. Mg75 TaxID=3445357 RepID=UPI003EED08B1
MLVVVDGPGSAAKQLLEYTRLDNTHVVALLRETTGTAAAAAIRVGADGVCAWDSTTEQLVVTITAAASGFVMLPASIALQLVRPERRIPDDLAWVSDSQLRWLHELGRGSTIAHLARTAGYSERAMHRLLRDLYSRLGVHNRSDALVLAARCGLFEKEMA